MILSTRNADPDPARVNVGSPAGAPSSKRDASGAPRTIRVLLVDDEPQVTASLATGLRRQRFEIHTAQSADEAVHILAEHEIDVVVSDERMPGTTGCKLLAQVRRAWPSTKRIMLSGSTEFSATLAAINEAHVFRFLTKPRTPEDLAFCIRQAAACGEAVVEPSRPSPPDTDSRRFRDAMDLLWVAYQPVVKARDRGLFAYEALLRCDAPEYSSADEVLKHAERLDEIEMVDRRIRTLAGDDMARIPASTHVLVNIHPRSMMDEHLYSGANPLRTCSDRVIIELTERESLSAIRDLSERAERLRALGYRTAVDDLGAGYAGLSTFATVNPDVVKFDMELIRGIDRSPTKAKVVQSMTALCRELGILTVAEGIETAAELQRAVELGCDLLQGYHIGRPARLPAR